MLLRVLAGAFWLIAATSVVSQAGTADSVAANYESQRVTAGQAARAMVADGFSAAIAVPAVVRAYQDCGATVDAIRSTAKSHPDQMTAVVQAVSRMDNCFCGASAMRTAIWTNQPPTGLASQRIELPMNCACAAIAVEASSTAVPIAVNAVDSAIAMLQPAGQSVDAVVLGQDGSLSAGREAQRCEASSAEAWSVGTPATPGSHSAQCNGSELLFSEARLDAKGEGYLEVYNPSSADKKDLLRDRYVLEVTMPNAESPARRVELTGVIEPGTAALIKVGNNMSSAVEPVVTSGALPPIAGGQVRLLRDVGPDECACSESLAGAVLRGLLEEQIENEVDADAGELVEAWNAQSSRTIVTGIDAAKINRRSETGQTLSTRVLQRAQDDCGNQPLAMFMRFDDDRLNLKDHETNCPDEGQGRVFISEVAWREDGRMAVELFNPGAEAIDLAAAGIMMATSDVEMNDNEDVSDPIALFGTVGPRETFVVADQAFGANPASVDATLDNLSVGGQPSVALRLYSEQSPQRCTSPVAALFATDPSNSVSFVPLPEPPGQDDDPGGTPVDDAVSPN